MKGKPRKQVKDIALDLQGYEKKASDIIKNLPHFSFEMFSKKYLNNSITNELISTAFVNYIKILNDNNQIGTALSYQCANTSITKFKPAAKLQDVTPTFLRAYEQWMLSRGCSITTVGIYLRSLRTLINIAISDTALSRDSYPFGKRRFEIPTGRNIKKAITLPVIGSIYNYKAVPGSNLERSRDYWLFMYFCNGMNMKDLCLLKFENIKGNWLLYQRAKTIRTKRTIELIRIPITEHIKDIIEKHGSENRSPEAYIFPILTNGLNAVRERQVIQQRTSLVNDHMKIIAEELGIDGCVTTYAARHSFATILQRSGESTSFISEALGHSNIQTTQHYLAGFEDSKKHEAAKALTAFAKTD
jgi:integrase